jgi:hypothetical protein
MSDFKEFINKQTRDTIKQLGIIKKILEHADFRTVDFTDEDDPYLFVYAPDDDLSFDGIRIYKVGDQIAFRIQRESKTHPYGKAYPLNLEEMFSDMLSDHSSEEKAGKAVIVAVVSELKRFFKQSRKAEQEIRAGELDKNRDALGRVIIRASGTDFSNMIHTKGN